jgi:allantoate deiminase
MNDLAREIMARIQALGRISEESGRLTRTFCSPAMRRTNDLVGRWMGAAGMTVREDVAGNVIGHYAGELEKSKVQSPKSKVKTPRSGVQIRTARRPDEERVLVLGSHLDTVRNAGEYDGPLGVLLALACVEMLSREGERPPFGIEVIGFSDEEGVRFQSAYLGSRAVVGSLGGQDLKREDADGISMAEAMAGFWRGRGARPRRAGALRSGLREAQMDPRRLIGYVEAHIEQGPVLEKNGFSVGVVTAIAGQSRFRFMFTGQAGHAGTTPMSMRRDALCAASEFVLAVEEEARPESGLVATVGQIQAEPNASNVIPGSVVLTLDVRHQKDAVRQAAAKRLGKIARRIGDKRGVRVSGQLVQQTAAVPCSPWLSSLVQRAAAKHQRKALALPSGAGHDAAVLAQITPVAMLFIRCKGGISHHPEESVKLADVRVALAVLCDFVRLLAEQVKSQGGYERL